MATIKDERGYRAAEKKHAKDKAKRQVEDGMDRAKSALMDILSPMESAGNMKQFHKLNVILSKLESLQLEMQNKG